MFTPPGAAGRTMVFEDCSKIAQRHSYSIAHLPAMIGDARSLYLIETIISLFFSRRLAASSHLSPGALVAAHPVVARGLKKHGARPALPAIERRRYQYIAIDVSIPSCAQIVSCEWTSCLRNYRACRNSSQPRSRVAARTCVHGENAPVCRTGQRVTRGGLPNILRHRNRGS